MEAVKASGGVVFYDWQVIAGELPRDAPPRGAAWLRAFTGNEYFQEVVSVRYIDLPGFAQGGTATSGDAIDFGPLRSLPDLRSLSLEGRRVDDRALETVGRLTSLESLNLENTSVTDAGLREARSPPPA